MAAYEELRAQYGLTGSEKKDFTSSSPSYQELRKKYGLTGELGSSRSYEDLRKRYGLAGIEEDAESYINSFISDYNTFYQKWSSNAENAGWSEAMSGSSQMQTEYGNLQKRSGIIRNYLDQNREWINPDYYDEAIANLDTAGSGYQDLQDAYSSLSEYYGQWGSQEEYDTWKLNYEAQQEAKAQYDQYQQDKQRLQELLAERDRRQGLIRDVSSWSFTLGFDFDSLWEGQQSFEDLNAEISQLQASVDEYEAGLWGEGHTGEAGTYLNSTPAADGLTAEAREQRLSEIESQISDLKRQNVDYQRDLRFDSTGNVSSEIQGNNQKISELEEERRTLILSGASTERERLGYQLEFAQQDLAAAREEIAAPAREGPPGDLAATQDAGRRAAELDAEVRRLKAMIDWIDDVDEYTGKKYDDNFLGQYQANRALGRLSQDSSMYWSAYMADPSEENRILAENADEMIQKLSIINSETLADDGTLPWISRDLANYMPQFWDQLKYKVGGGLAGAALTMGNPWGVKAGYVSGSAAYGYSTMRGAAFRELIKAGMDEDTARAAANDEAVISSLIEAGDSILDLALLGAGSAIDLATKGGATAVKNWLSKAAGKNVVTKLLTALGKYALNAGGEYLEESSQEAVSIANQERDTSGILDLAARAISTYLLIFNADSEDEQDKQAQMREAGMGGLRLGLMMGGGEMVGNAAVGSVVGNIRAEMEVGALRPKLQELTAKTLELNPNDKNALRVQARLEQGKNVSGMDIYKMLLANEEAAAKKDAEIVREAVASRLTELGEQGDIDAIAEAVSRLAAGEELRRRDFALIQESKYAQQIVRELNLLGNNEGTPLFDNKTEEAQWRDNVNTLRKQSRDYAMDLSGNVVSPDVQRIINRLIRDGVGEQEAAETARKLAEAGKIYGKQADVFTNSYLKGQSVEQYRLAFANIYQAGKDGTSRELIKDYGQGLTEAQKELAYLAGQKAGENNKALQSIQEDDILDVNADGKTIRTDTNEDIEPTGFESVGENGTLSTKGGQSVSIRNVAFASYDDAVLYNTIAKVSPSANIANTLLRQFRAQDSLSAIDFSAALMEAYEAGQIGDKTALELKDAEFAGKLTTGQREVVYNRGKRAAHQQAYQRQQDVKKKPGGKKGGKLHFDRKGRKFDSVRESSLAVMDTLSKALGVDIYVYESYVNEKGQRVYLSDRGEKKAPNGYYDPSDGSIHIDLNAGQDGKGTMLFTVAHELTHFIKDWSSVKYRALADALVKQYQKQGVTVSELVDNQIAKAEKNGREMSRPEAFDEVVADSMESMLTDENAAAFLEKLAQRDKGLKEKIVSWLKELAAKLKNALIAYKDVKPDSPEGKMVAEMEDFRKEIMGIYTSALVDAGENFRENGGTLTSDGDYLYSERVTDKDTLDFLNSQETVTTYKTMQIVDGKLYPPMASRIGGKHEDYSVLGEWEQATEHPELIKENGKFKLDKGKGQGSIEAAYNPYMHSSNLVINDQFSGAYARDNLVTVECEVPVSELTSGYRAQYAKDSVGWHAWHTGTVGGAIRKATGVERQVLLSRWIKPVRILSDSEVAAMYKDLLDGTDISVPDNVVTPSLLSELKKAGVKINESGRVKHSYLEGGQKSSEEVGLEVDEKTDSVAPAVIFSERTWTESDYVQERETAAKEIAKAMGVSEKKAKAYIDSVNSIAKMIADDRTRLDYFSSPGRSSFVSNVEYGGSFDFSTLCKKRRLLTGTFTAIQKALPNTALTANEILEIRNRMKEAGLEVSCGLCYVEGSRANMGQFAKEFLRLYKQYYPDSWQPNMADVNTPDGIEWVRINHPEVYEQYEYFWNHYGKLKPDDKNLFASQQKPKLYQLHTEYNGEILKYFKNDNKVDEKNKNGGIRLQSFSDFEIVHLIDTMQIIMDMARVGLAGQAYTKVPDFAWALGDTGLKINLSLIAKSVDQNGKLIFDDVEGMRLEDAMRLRSRYPENVGTILVVFNDEQLYAAMADDRIDFIIPFHRSQWKKSQYSAMGLPSNTKDYTYMQNEKYIRPQYHEYRGKMVRDKATNYMPNEYWDFGKSGKENAQAYLELCARNNKRPKFYKLLQNNGDGSYSLKDDGSTDGYWKLLIDFKMYDNEGNGSPQVPVKPDFNMEESRRMLDDYRGGHSSFPVANGIVDQFVSEYKESHNGIQFSDRDPTAEDTRAALEKENGKLREDVSRLRELLRLQGKVTGGTVMKPSSVEAAARWLNKYAGAKADVKELSRMLTEFYRFIATDKDYSWEDVHQRAMVIAKYLQDNVQIKPQISDYARDVLRDIRGIKITLDESQRAEVEYQYGSYEAFRKAAFGNVTFVKEGGIPLGSQWHEWASLYPGTFDSEITATDQPQSLMDAIDALRNSDTTVMEYAYNRESIAQDLAVAVYDSYWRVDALRTVADRDQRKINDLTARQEALKGTISEKNAQIKKLRAEHRTEMDKLKNDRNETIAALKQKRQEDMKKLRTDYRKKLEETRTRYQESREKAVDSRNRAKMREQVKKTVNELNHLLLDGDKKRHVPESMRKAVAEILSAVNMETSTAEARSAAFERTVARYNQRIKMENDPAERARLEAARDAYIGKGDQFKAKIDALAKAYEDIKESADPGLQDAYSDAVSQYLFTLEARVGDTRLGDMTLDQLKTVQEVLRIVLSTIRNANKSFLNERAGTIEQQAKRCISEVSSVWRKKKEGESDVGRWLRGFHYRNLKPIYLMRAIGSDALTQAYNNLRRGEDTWYRDIQGGREFFLSQSGKYGYGEWDFEKTTPFSDNSGGEVKLTLGQIMSLYAYSKREAASEHLRIGGVVIEGEAVRVNKLGMKVTYHLNDATSHQLGPDALGKIIGTLTKEQMAFVDAMQDYLSTVMADKGNEVSLAMYGIKLFNEKNYFPIKSAKQFVDQKNEPVGEVKLKNSGFTNKTVPKANNPMVLRGFMDVWADHVNEMSTYHAFVLAIEDFNRIINYQTERKEGAAPVSLKQTIQNYMGQEAVSAVRELIQSVNGGARVDPSATFVSKAINLFKKNAVFSSSSVVIQQPSAIVRAAALIDPKYFVGRTIDREKVNTTWEIIKKYAPVAGIKDMGYFDTNMGKSTVDYLKGPEHDGAKDAFIGIFKREKGSFDELLSMAPGYADKVTWCAIWEAVKRETAAKHPKLATRSEEFLKICGERFTEVITKTQVYDSVFARSGHMRSKDTGMGMATSFMAEPTTSINMIYDAVLQWTRGDKAYMRRAIGAVIGAAVLNAVLKSIIYAERDDDDDETFGEKYVSALVAALKDDVLFLVPNSIPFVRDIMSLVQGYSVERMDMELADDLISAVKKLHSDKASSEEKILGVLGSFGNLLFPAKNMIREVKTLINVIDTFRNSESSTAMGIRNAIREGWSGETVSNARQLYEARMAGDTAHEERIAARYENEKSANAAVVSAIKEAFMDGDLSEQEAQKHLILYGNTDAGEAYWKVKEWIYAKDKGTTDGYGKYNDLYDAILNGGDIQAAVEEFTENGYDEDEVMSNVKKEVGRWFWDDESETRISAEQASDILEKYFGMKQDEIQETILKWTMKKETGISYSELREAFQDDIVSEKEAASYLEKYGGMTQVEAQETILRWKMVKETGIQYDDLKEAVMEQSVSESDAIAYLKKYGGMTEYDAKERVADWRFEAEHGYAYDDIKATYLDDEITRAEAIAVMTEIGGKSREEAEQKVAYWDYEDDTGVDYENRAQQYKRGIITRQQLRQALIDLGEYSSEDADIHIEVYDWEQSGLRGASFTRVKNWHEYCEPAGVSRDMWLKIALFSANTENDKDEDGNSIRYSAMKKVMAEINKLPISKDQKTAIARAIGWSEKNIARYKLW